MNELIAKDGYWLTELADTDNRSFWKKLKGATATLEHWKEVSDAYKVAWENDHPIKDK